MDGLLWEQEIRQAEHVRLLGRFDPQQPVFPMYWTGSGLELRLRCTELDVELECDYAIQCPWLGVMVDGAPVERFPLSRAHPGRDNHRSAALTVVRRLRKALEKKAEG